jgi:hypothetical protein
MPSDIPDDYSQLEIEGCGRNNKEVGGDQLMDVIGEEGLPGL